MVGSDEKIIELRIGITSAASSQLNNGIITSTAYLTELNNEIQAWLNLELHKIMLIKAKLDYKATLGNL